MEFVHNNMAHLLTKCIILKVKIISNVIHKIFIKGVKTKKIWSTHKIMHMFNLIYFNSYFVDEIYPSLLTLHPWLFLLKKINNPYWDNVVKVSLNDVPH